METSQVIEKHYREGIAVEMRTGPADLEAASKVIKSWYARLGFPEPEIRRMPSPYAAELEARRITGKKEVWTWCRGSGEAYWVWWYLVGQELAKHLSMEEEGMLREWEVLCRSCGWVYFLDAIVLVCDSPAVIHILDNPPNPISLHWEGGKAIEFPDGWGISALWNIIVPHWVAAKPLDEIKPAEILEIHNADQRRVAVRRYGIRPLLEGLQAKTIERDSLDVPALNEITGEPTGGHTRHAYELLEFKLPGVRTPTHALKMCYASGPMRGAELVEMVPPWIRTCQEARQWRTVGGATREEFEAKEKPKEINALT